MSLPDLLDLPPAIVTELPGDAPDHPLVIALKAAFAASLAGESRLPDEVLGIEGMSGRRYRYFINQLVSKAPAPRYLEVGSWAGSTMCAAIQGNRLRAFAIDNWSEFGGPSQRFLLNVARWINDEVEFNVLTLDFRQVDYQRIGRFNLYLFDGPHTEIDQYDGVVLALPALDEEFVLIVDDWNWQAVRDGTFKAIAEQGLQILQGYEVRTTLDNSHPKVSWQNSDWHNGYFMAVLRQTQPRLSLIH